MSPLEGALTLPEMNQIPVLVAEDLHLDVARRRDELLGIDGVVAEERHCLARHALVGLTQILLALDHAQAFTSAAGTGLNHDREAGTAREVEDLLERLHRLGQPGHNRHTGGLHSLP